MNETQRKQIKGALLKCAEENENKVTPTFCVVVSSVCKSAVERIEELEAENELIKNSDTLCKLIGEQKRNITKLEERIEKMKCCENCKYNSYWGNELHCNYGLKEALQEDKLVECNNMDEWELKEND